MKRGKKIPLLNRVPQRGCTNPIVDERKEGFLDEQLTKDHLNHVQDYHLGHLCVKDDELGRGGNEVIAAVELEELDKDLVLVLF